MEPAWTDASAATTAGDAGRTDSRWTRDAQTVGGHFGPSALLLAGIVTAGTMLGRVEKAEIRAPFDGFVRGLLADGTPVQAGLKIGDVDPRAPIPTGAKSPTRHSPSAVASSKPS